MSIVDWDKEDIVAAFESVLPDGDERANMDDRDVADYLLQHEDEIADALREVVNGDTHDVGKSTLEATGETIDLSKSMYGNYRNEGLDRVDGEIAEVVDAIFEQPDAPDADASRIPSLSHFYPPKSKK